MGGGRSSSTSSGEDDGDADWKAAIYSVASTTTFNGSTPNGVVSTSNGSLKNSKSHEDPQVDNNEPQKLKHYQIKALKLLDDLLEKEIEIVRDPMPVPGNNTVKNEGGVRLFSDAPRGIVFDHVDELEGPRKRPRIIPGKEIDEKSKKFRRQLQSVAIEGTDIIAEARDAYQKRLAKLEAKDAAAKAAAKREEERIAELKKIRGERWLPSIAKYMKCGNQMGNLSLRWREVLHDNQAVGPLRRLMPHISLENKLVYHINSVIYSFIYSPKRDYNGALDCIATLWGLQEWRFAIVYDAVSSAGRSLIMALMFCFLTVYRGLGEFSLFFL